MPSIRKVSRFDVVLEVNSANDRLENTCAATIYYRMLTTSKNLLDEVGAIHVLPREFVQRPKGAWLSIVLANKGLGPRLAVGPARGADGGLDEYVKATVQVPCHGDGIIRTRTFSVVDTFSLGRIKAEP